MKEIMVGWGHSKVGEMCV